MSDSRYATIQASLLEGGAVLRVLLDQPRANVLSMAMMADLSHALDAHRNDPALKLVIVRGAGGNFSFGASVPEHKRESAPQMLSTFHDLVRRVARYPVPIAALVEGKCLGGAFELVLASHFVFPTDDAVFACPEVKLGVIPPVLAVLGHHRLGAPLAERMLITGGELTARDALGAGLAAAIAPKGDEAEPWLLGWYARTLAALSAFSLREATYAARHGSGMLERLERPLADAERRYVTRLLASHDGNEGIEAFLAKRAPKWVNA